MVDLTLVKELKQMGFVKTDTVLIHSSLKSINRDAFDIIDTLKDYFSGGNVLMPTHTWAYLDEVNNVYDVVNTKSCTGLLTEIFRKSNNVKRSLHPTHSLAGYGKDIDELFANELDCNTPCGIEGVYNKLSSFNAKVLLIGCGLEKNTFIHAIEEKARVLNRFTKDPVTFIIKDENLLVTKAYYRHYNERYPNLSLNYPRIHDELVTQRILNEGSFGDASVYYFNAYDLAEYLLNKLNKDRQFFGE